MKLLKGLDDFRFFPLGGELNRVIEFLKEGEVGMACAILQEKMEETEGNIRRIKSELVMQTELISIFTEHESKFSEMEKILRSDDMYNSLNTLNEMLDLYESSIIWLRKYTEPFKIHKVRKDRDYDYKDFVRKLRRGQHYKCKCHAMEIKAKEPEHWKKIVYDGHYDWYPPHVNLFDMTDSQRVIQLRFRQEDEWFEAMIPGIETWEQHDWYTYGYTIIRDPEDEKEKELYEKIRRDRW